MPYDMAPRHDTVLSGPAADCYVIAETEQPLVLNYFTTG